MDDYPSTLTSGPAVRHTLCSVLCYWCTRAFWIVPPLVQSHLCSLLYRGVQSGQLHRHLLWRLSCSPTAATYHQPPNSVILHLGLLPPKCNGADISPHHLGIVSAMVNLINAFWTRPLNIPMQPSQQPKKNGSLFPPRCGTAFASPLTCSLLSTHYLPTTTQEAVSGCCFSELMEGINYLRGISLFTFCLGGSHNASQYLQKQWRMDTWRRYKKIIYWKWLILCLSSFYIYSI